MATKTNTIVSNMTDGLELITKNTGDVIFRTAREVFHLRSESPRRSERILRAMAVSGD